jgi:hypothetical protein
MMEVVVVVCIQNLHLTPSQLWWTKTSFISLYALLVFDGYLNPKSEGLAPAFNNINPTFSLQQPLL